MKKDSLVHRFTENADLPGESLPKQPLVEICADSRVLIENHKGVTEYSGEQIGVRVRFGTVLISGKMLQICRMTSCQLVIAGRIDAVTLIRR